MAKLNAWAQFIPGHSDLAAENEQLRQELNGMRYRMEAIADGAAAEIAALKQELHTWALEIERLRDESEKPGTIVIGDEPPKKRKKTFQVPQ